MTKKRKVVSLVLFLTAFVFLLPHSAIGQQVSFTLSKDTIHSFEDLIINNTSVDLPPGTGFRWEVSGANFLKKDSMAYYQDSTGLLITFIENDTQFVVKPGFPTTFPSDTLRFTLVAIDSNGVPLAIPDFGNTVLLFYVTPIYQCADQVNDPCINLVCNPSFEELLSYHLNAQSLFLAEPWLGGHAEVFSSAAIGPNAALFSVPNNVFGTQNAKTGGGYAGFHPNWSFGTKTIEIISNPLKYNLNNNQTYQVTFWASLANRSNVATELIAYLDLEPANPALISGFSFHTALIPANPAGVVQNTVGHITDMTNWTEVTGVFTPQTSGAHRLWIGSPDPFNIIIPSTVGDYPQPLAYYYIDDVEVVPLPPSVTIAGSPIFINGCMHYIMTTSDPQNVARYEWSINGVIQPCNLPNCTLPSNGVSIELTVYNYHDCPVTHVFPVEPPCIQSNTVQGDPDIILSDLTASDLIANFTGGLSNWSTGNVPINILGTLTIDVDFTFSNCHSIAMGRDAKIVVEQNVSFMIENCTIYSCNFECFMWDGIYATDPSSLVVINVSSISHAKNAVYSRNNPALEIVGNSFTNNIKGIHLTNHQNNYAPVPVGQTPPTPVPANVLIAENHFSGDLWNYQVFISQYLSGFDGMEWGIIIDTVDLLNIGPGNTFRQLSCGIHINTGNVFIGVNSFDFIRHHTNNPLIDKPYGHIFNDLFKEGAIVVNNKLPSGSGLPPIYLPSSGVAEKLIVENNNFENCRLGVYAWDVPIEIIDNTFHNTMYNALRGQKLRSAVVADNTHSYTVATVGHFDNVFNYEYYIAQPLRSLLGYNIDIRNNEINTFKSGINLTQATSTGVAHINPPRLVQIRDNTIYLDDIGPNPRKQAIRLNTCDRARVFRNTIANIDAVQIPSPNNPLDGLHGIHVSQTPDAMVFDNYTIKRFGKGIYNIGSNLGTQYWCNTLDGNYDGFYVPDQGAGSAPQVSAQLISTEENRNSFINVIDRRVNNENASNPITWYYTGPFNANNSRAPVNSHGVHPLIGQYANLACGPIPDTWITPTTRMELFGIIVSEGDTLYAALQDEFEWYADEYLYRAFSWDNGWMYLGVSDDSVYQHYFNFFENEAIMAFAEIEELIAMGDLEQALWENDHVVVQTLIEFNQQLVNEIYLETWAKGVEPDAYQTTLLEAVALLTPYVGGNAVYTARVMLDIDPFNYGLPFRMEQDTTDAQTLHVVFYPNPARNTLMVEFIEPVEGTGTFEMFDVQGRKVLTKHLYELQSHLSFDTSQLSDGLYVARLLLGNGQCATQKIVIKH